jgi:hypothetical protein
MRLPDRLGRQPVRCPALRVAQDRVEHEVGVADGVAGGARNAEGTENRPLVPWNGASRSGAAARWTETSAPATARSSSPALRSESTSASVIHSGARVSLTAYSSSARRPRRAPPTYRRRPPPRAPARRTRRRARRRRGRLSSDSRSPPTGDRNRLALEPRKRRLAEHDRAVQPHVRCERRRIERVRRQDPRESSALRRPLDPGQQGAFQ